MADLRGRLSSVRSRTTLLASVVVAVALTVGSVSLLFLLRDRLVAAELSAATLRSRDVAALASAGRLSDQLSYPGEEDGFSQVVRIDGAVIAATRNISGEPAVSRTRPPVGSVADEIRADLPVGEGQRFAISARTVNGDNGPVTVYSGASLDSVDDTVASVATFLAVGVPLLTLLVAIVTRRVVDRSLAPVDSIRAQVADISERDLHKRVPEPRTGDEIDRLAHSMNSMLGRLERSSDRQRALVADASHELRSPLASARTTLEVAVAHPGDRNDLLAVIGDALRDHDRLDALVEDLLTLARLDDPAAITHADEINLTAVVRSELADRADPATTPVLEEGAVPVTGDRRQLHRMLTNLLDNAATHRRTRTDVTVHTDGTSAVLYVDDDGPGIPPEDRERVFERFVRLDAARTSERGTGLGLAIVRDIVRAHHGTVTIEASPTGGARLVVRIPLREDRRSLPVWPSGGRAGRGTTPRPWG